MSSDPRLSSLLLRWQERRRQGQTLTADQLCADCPELRDVVGEQIRARMEAFISSVDAPERTGPYAPGPAAADTSLPAQAGRFRLLGEIARGGMGAVLRAHDPLIGRDVALKVILPQHGDDGTLRRRFLDEVRLAGQLQHPGVAPVYDLGELPDGRPYFAMKLIEGRTLDALLRERADPSRDLPRFLNHFEAVCQTVGYAHARGVIHRDLKPQNIMVGAFGEVQVMDWGLAKALPLSRGRSASPDPALADRSRLGVPADHSHAGAVVGTLAYMAPEQARGETDRIDACSDAFGLGAILCEILTGRPPFRAKSMMDLLAQSAGGDLSDAFAGLDGCGADAELVRLAKACLAPERDERPADGGAVAAGVAAYLAGVQARLRQAEVARARAEEEKKRRRTQLALALAVLVLVVVGGGGAWLFQQQRQTRAAEVARQRHEAEQRIQLALEDAGNRLDEAKLTGRMELYPEAKASLDKASEVAGTSPVGGNTSGEIDALEQRWQTEFDAAKKSQRLLTACLDVRQPREVARYERSESGLMSAMAEPSTDEQFASVFRAWDSDFDVARPEEALKRLRAMPDPVLQELVAALDEWWQARRDAQPPGAWRTLHDLADRLDTNKSRRELRGLLVSGELEGERRAAEVAAAALPLSGLLRMGRGGLDEMLGAAALAGPEMSRKLAQEVGRNRRRLRGLAGRIDAHNESVLTVLALSRALARSRDEASAEDVLSAVLTARPGEATMWIELGKLFESEQPPRFDRAIECYRAARAIRPEFGVALGKALRAADRRDEGEAVLRELVRGLPDHPDLHFWLAVALYDNRDFSGTVTESRTVVRLKPDYAEAHVNLGAALYAQDKMPEAEAEFRVAIRLKPDLFEARCNLGHVLKAQGKLTEAVPEYREAIRLRPEHPKVHNDLGNALKDQGKLPEAVAVYREAIRLKRDYPEAHTNLGAALADQGKLAEAVAEYREAIRLKPDLPGAHSNLGVALADQGELPEAVAECREAIRLKPGFPEAHCNLGNALYHQGKLPEAVAEYREAVRLKPDYADAQDSLGSALYGQGKVPEAVAEFRMAIRLKPASANAHSNLGNALRKQGKLPEAVAECRAAIRLKPDFPEAHVNLALALHDHGKLPEAVAEYHAAIRLEPDLPNAHNGLGNALYGQGKLPEAVAEYREAGRLKPDYPDAHHNLGIALIAQGKLPEAVAEYREAIRLKRDFPQAHIDLGNALKAQGKLPDAVAEYHEAIRLKPDLPGAHYNLGTALRDQGKLPEAVAEFREAIRLKPGYPEAHDNLGIALANQGKLPEAVAEFREAIRLKPGYPEAHYNLGTALQAQGELPEAMAEFREAIRLNPGHPQAHCNLGNALRQQGEFEASLAEYRRGHELGVNTPTWSYPSAEWVRDAERLVELDRHLPRLLDGSFQPATPGECLEYVSHCRHPARRLHVAALRLSADAFSTEPKLADDLEKPHRYNAACSAALAAAGRTQDAKNLPDKVSAGLRRQALLFLRADLALYAKLADSDQAAAKETVRQHLAHWQQDADLATVRDAIDQLPETDRAAWRQLWQDVDDLMKRAAAAK